MKTWQKYLWQDFKGAWAFPLTGLVLLIIAATFVQLSVWFIPVGIVGVALLIWGFVGAHMKSKKPVKKKKPKKAEPEVPIEQRDGMGIIEGWVESNRYNNQASVLHARNQRDAFILEGKRTNLEIKKTELAEGSLEEDHRLERERLRSGHLVQLAENEDKISALELADIERAARRELIAMARKEGIDPNIFPEVQRHRLLKEIDIEARWKEIVQDLDAADLMELSAHQLLRKELQYFEELVRRRYKIEKSKTPKPIKRELLSELDNYIQNLRRRIRAQQAGLLSSEDGEEARQITAGSPYSGADSGAAVPTTEEQLPASRGRGRPAGSRDTKPRRTRKSSSHSGDDGGGQE